MWYEQERGFRGRFVRDESAQEEARLRAMAHFIGGSVNLRPSGEELTDRELRALLALAQGKPVREIARTALAFSTPHLRKGTLKPIRVKLGARNNAHAVRVGFEEELLNSESINPKPRRPLSATQRDVAELISLGAANRDICQIMDIAPETATSHWTEIKKRYGVETAEHATGVGIAIGDIPLRPAA